MAPLSQKGGARLCFRIEIRPEPPQSDIMRVLILLLVLVSCGRPLTENEMQFAAHIHGPDLDTAKVRLMNKAPVKSYTLRARKRPRVACTERIYPEPKTEFITGAPSAVALFNKIWVNEDYYLDDYMVDYGEKLRLYEALFLAHELTHAWQWQNRKLTGYHPLKAAREHQTKDDPYLIDPDTDGDFLSFGYEQQGRIVEEYLCCSLLDPKAPRTARLEAMLKEYFPLERLPSKSVIIGWKDVKVKGICR